MSFQLSLFKCIFIECTIIIAPAHEKLATKMGVELGWGDARHYHEMRWIHKDAVAESFK